MENSPLKGPPFDLCLFFSCSLSLSHFGFPDLPLALRSFSLIPFHSSLSSLSASISLRLSRSPSLGWFLPVRNGGPQARQRWDQATRKDHLVLYILTPAAMILSTAFKNIRRSRWITRRKSVAVLCNCSLFLRGSSFFLVESLRFRARFLTTTIFDT